MPRKGHGQRAGTTVSRAGKHPHAKHAKRFAMFDAWTPSWQDWFAAVPVGLAVALSANILTNGFVADDTVQIVRNTAIRSLANIPFAFVTSVWSFAKADIVFSIDNYFRPVFNIYLTAGYPLFGTSAWAWHFASIAVHAAVVYLVFLVARDVTENNWVALVAATLFAVHPAHSESVAWISGVTDPLMALFALAAFWFYWRYRTSGRSSMIVWSALLFFASLLTKETAIALPVVVLYCELFYFTDGERIVKRSARALITGGIFAIPVACYTLLRWYALNGLVAATGAEYPAASAAKTLPDVVLKYLRLTFLPYGYSYQHYTSWVQSIQSTRFVVPGLVILLVIAGIAAARSRVLTLSAVWFFAWLAPALAAIRHFDPEYLVQERYLYVPTAGACIALAAGIIWIGRRTTKFGPIIPAALSVAAVLALAQAYVRQNTVWHDDLALYTNCVSVDPLSTQALNAQAAAYYAAGNKVPAESEALDSLNKDSGDPRTYMLLSYFAKGDGSVERAIYYLKQGTDRVKPGPYTRFQLATLYLNLGFLYEQQSKPDLAEQSMLKSVELWQRPVGWYYLGQFYMDQGRYDRAVDLFGKALRSTPPRFAPIHLKLAKAYDGLGDKNDARREYHRYLELAPDSDERPDVERRLSQM